MKRLIILFSTLAVSILFMAFSPTGRMGFMFSDMTLSSELWFYYFFEHLILVLLAAVILDLEPTYKVALRVFLCIQIADTIDYCLTYGDPWIPGFPPLFNFLKIIAFGLAIIYDKNK